MRFISTSHTFTGRFSRCRQEVKSTIFGMI